MKRVMRETVLRAFFAALSLLILANPVLAADKSDKFLGVWKVNKAKSKFIRDREPKNLKLKWKSYGNGGVRFSSERFAAEGSIQYTAFYDGKDYPVRFAEGYDTVSLNRIDANTVECTFKKNGHTVSTSRRVLSPDGVSMTVTATGTNADGEAQTTAVYDKESD
jgi:hypothetical protein